MIIGVFWNSFSSIDISEENYRETLFSYLIEQNKNNYNFCNFFECATIDTLKISLLSKDIINAENSIINSKQFLDFSALFILAELDWHGHKLSDFYGVKIAQQLRLNNIKIPIFICSFLSQEEIVKITQSNFLLFRGCYFIHLATGLISDHPIEPIDDMELVDVQSHYCGLEGSIREIFHRKQAALGQQDIEKGRNILKNIFLKIRNLTNIPETLIEYIDREVIKINNLSDFEKLENYCKIDESEMLSYLSTDISNKAPNLHFITGNWEILLLDDEPNDENIIDIIKDLESIGVSKIHIAETHEKAKEIIEKDIFNKITVVICDYRLHKDGLIKGKQGYSFIQWLSHQPRLNDIFVLSGLSRKFLKDIFKKYEIRVHVNSKYEIIQNKRSEFIDEIIEAGNRIDDAILSMPTAVQWEELKNFYMYYRGHDKYFLWEEQISLEANQIISSLISVIESIKIDSSLGEKIQKKQFDSEVKHELEKCQIIQLKNIRAKTYVERPINKDTVIPKEAEIKTYKKDTKEKYTYIINKAPMDYIDEFKNKLLARRIAIFLHFKYGLQLQTIYNLLDKGTTFENEEAVWEDSARKIDNEITKIIDDMLLTTEIEKHNKHMNDLQKLISNKRDVKKQWNKRKVSMKQISFNLGLQISDYPGKLLVEEKEWLNKMNLIDIKSQITLIDKLDHLLFDFFSKNLPHINEVKNQNIILDFSDLKVKWIELSSEKKLKISKEFTKNFHSFAGIKSCLLNLKILLIDKPDLWTMLCNDTFELLNKTTNIQGDFSIKDFSNFLDDNK